MLALWSSSSACLRSAAGAYTKATAELSPAMALASGRLGAAASDYEADLRSVDGALDSAVAVAAAEFDRLCRVRTATRAFKYEALVQRWYTLRRSVDSATAAGSKARAAQGAKPRHQLSFAASNQW